MARRRVDWGVLLLLTRLVSPPPSTAAFHTSLGASSFIPTSSPLFPSSPAFTPRLPFFPPSLPCCLSLLPATSTVSTSRSPPCCSTRGASTTHWSLLLFTSSATSSTIVAPTTDSAWRDFCLERTRRSSSHPSHLSLRTSLLRSLAASPRRCLSYLFIRCGLQTNNHFRQFKMTSKTHCDSLILRH